MQKDQEGVQELFALPIGMKVVAKIDGFPVYGSNYLKKQFIKAIGKTPHGKPVISTIEKLVNDGKIIPCFMNKNLSKLIKFKIFASPSVKNLLGFYDTRSKKIFILIENNLSFGFASNDWITTLTIHEVVHMLADKKPSNFISTFKKRLEDYYYNLFNLIFDLKERPKEMGKIVDYIFSIERSKSANNSTLTAYFKFLDKTLSKYTNMNETQFKQRLTDYIVIIKIYWKSVNILMRNYRQFLHVLKPLYEAYEKTYGFKISNIMCIQEFVVPSEVIAVYSEYKTQDIAKGVNKL